MIDSSKLKIGDTVYVVKETCTAFSKKKIKTVINGVEWFRYDRDHWEYSVQKLEYCGHVTVTIEGEVSIDVDTQNQMHFKYPEGSIYYEYDADIDTLADWFHTVDEAVEYAENMRILKNNE